MPSLKPETARERRGRLLEAATRCFARRGYRGTSMRDIASEAGVTTGAIYAHFAGKKALLNALAREFESRRAEAFEPASPEVGAAEALAQSLSSLTDYLGAADADDLLRSDLVMLAEGLNVPTLRKQLVAADRQHLRAYERILGRQGRWRKGVDVRTLAQVVTGSVFGLLILRAYHANVDRSEYLACVRALVEAAAGQGERQAKAQRGRHGCKAERT